MIFHWLRAGVLRLVDEHVVDPEVELVQHPGGGGAREQFEGLVDEVVVIQEAAAVLLAAIAADHFVGDGDQRARALACGQRTLAAEQAADAILLRLQTIEPIGMILRDRFGDDILPWRQLGGAEDLEVFLDARSALRGASSVECSDVFLVAREPRFERLDQQGPFLHGNKRGGEEVVLDTLPRVGGVDAEFARQFRHGAVDAAGTGEPCGELVALADGLADDILEGLVGGDDDRLRQRPAERALRIGGGFLQSFERQAIEGFRRRRVVEHAEARGDIGFERKLVQQSCAKGVDGLHLQAARRLQRRGEQAARARRAAKDRACCPSRAGCVRRVRCRRARPSRRACRRRGSPCLPRPPW